MAPFSHNFITHDGETPHAITLKAKRRCVEISECADTEHAGCLSGKKYENEFRVTLEDGSIRRARKLIFASGIKDIMPANDLKGFPECWGKSILHCPYCHGYEYRNKPTLILAEGEATLKLPKFSANGPMRLQSSPAEVKLPKANLLNRSKDMASKQILGRSAQLTMLMERYLKYYLKMAQLQSVVFCMQNQEYRQACPIPEELGCKLSEKYHILIDESQRTSVSGVYAAGDCANMLPRKSDSQQLAEHLPDLP